MKTERLVASCEHKLRYFFVPLAATKHLRQGRAGVLKRATNEQRLMGPRRSEGWLNINIFFQKLLAGGGGGDVANFSGHKNAYENFSVIFS